MSSIEMSTRPGALLTTSSGSMRGKSFINSSTRVSKLGTYGGMAMGLDAARLQILTAVRIHLAIHNMQTRLRSYLG